MKGGGLKERLQALGAQVASSASKVAAAATKAVSQEVLGAQCLLDYNVGGQVASSNHWRIYTARAKKEGSPHAVVAAWILDKRELTHAEESPYGGGGGGGGTLTRPSQRRLEQFLEQCRHDVQALVRLKHPCVLRLVAPLEETRTQLVFITEPVFASLADLLGSEGSAALPPQLAQERRGLKLSELEIKHGLLQVADGLHFLHSEAGLVHKNICPASVLITAAGAWKLAGFAFSAPADYSAPGQQVYDYSDPDPSALQQATQPPLPYVAPELVAAGPSGTVSGAADVFSLGAVAFELLARRQLLPVGQSLASYESRVHSLPLMDLTGLPSGLEQPLRQMVAPTAAARPPAAAFAGCAYFQGDVLLRALKFLDSMLQRDSMQKAAFLRDLPAMCAQFDGRVLRYKVLPPLLGELRDAQLQPTLLPIVLRIVQTQDPAEFADATLPALKPLLASADGETLLLLVQNAELLGRCMPPAAAAQVLPALLVRAAKHGDVRAQEEMLRKVAAMADTLDYEGLKAAVLPACHSLCLSTTSAAVRVSAFAAMSRLVQRMDQAEAENMLATATKVCAVDKSAPTAMCVLALGASLAAQWGPRLAAERVLPALAPLLVTPTLSAQQFATALKTVREVLAGIEKSRGGGGGGDGASPTGAAAARAAGAKVASAAAEPTDWLAATAVGPAGSAAASPSFGRAGGTRAPTAAAAGGGAANGDLLAGLQLQPGAAAAPAAGAGAAAAAGPLRPSMPAMPAAPAASSSAGGFGLSGKAGSGRPMAAPASGMAAAAPAPQPNWAAFSSAGGAGGSSSSSGFGAGGGPSARSLADPFAGLQLSGRSSTAAASSSSVQWPPPAAPAGGASASAAAFDPFGLQSATQPQQQWPAPAAAPVQQPMRPMGQAMRPAGQQQAQQQAQRPPGGPGFDSLI